MTPLHDLIPSPCISHPVTMHLPVACTLVPQCAHSHIHSYTTHPSSLMVSHLISSHHHGSYSTSHISSRHHGSYSTSCISHPVTMYLTSRHHVSPRALYTAAAVCTIGTYTPYMNTPYLSTHLPDHMCHHRSMVPLWVSISLTQMVSMYGYTQYHWIPRIRPFGSSIQDGMPQYL